MEDTYSMNGPGTMFWVILCVIIVIEIAAMWKVFEKAGQPGWACIIPIYNIVVLCQIAGKPAWWVLLYLIPLVNIAVSIMVKHSISKNFGHDVGFTLGLIFLAFIFYPILAWGESEYLGPSGGTPAPA